MKNRFYKFLVMLMTVIAIGCGVTMLNLTMQEKATGEKVSFRPYANTDQLYVAEEIQATVACPTVHMETSAPSDSLRESSQEVFEIPTEDTVLQQTSSGEKEIYYARLQDMEMLYSIRMNEVSKDTLAAQQKTVEELLEIWDDELNAIYQKLRKSLSDEDFRTLRDEERAWIRNRDTAAKRAASRETYSNSTQNLAYTLSLLQWTKDRVYELAAMYYGV